MKTKYFALLILLFGIFFISPLVTKKRSYHPEFYTPTTSYSFGINEVYAYPPAVGILTKATNCLVCHVDNGPWKDDHQTIIDIIDKDSGASLLQPNGTFALAVNRYEAKSIYTVIGRESNDQKAKPYRNAWLYIDTSTIATNSLSKFAPGWECNLPMACRLTGDKMKQYENADITVLPMTIRPTDAARDAEVQLQVMLTKGESIKGNTETGMIGNYFTRQLHLTVK